MRKLEVLDLNRTNVTKTGLEVITRLPALRTLMLSSDISRETIEHLRDLRPISISNRSTPSNISTSMELVTHKFSDFDMSANLCDGHSFAISMAAS